MFARRLFALTIIALIPPRPMLAQDAITAPPIPTELTAAFEARVYRNSAGEALPYRLLKPIDLAPDQKYPLVLFLHGAGERGADNALQLFHGAANLADEAMRRRHPAFLVFPQCPADKRWVEVPWTDKSHTMPAEPSDPLRLLLELLPALQKELAIDERRIYGVGLSMGAFGVWDILQRKPELLAAAAPVCGGGDPAYAARFKSIPVWAFHGDADDVVFLDRSHQMINALKAAGGRPIYTEYDGVAHNSWTQTFENRLLWDWLFAQHK